MEFNMEAFENSALLKYRHLDPRLNMTLDRPEWWRAALSGQKTDFGWDFDSRKSAFSRNLANLGSACPYSDILRVKYSSSRRRRSYEHPKPLLRLRSTLSSPVARPVPM